MFQVILSAILLGTAVDSQYTCECGLFLPEQFEGPNSVDALPLDAISTSGADATSCTSDTASNPCAQFCATVLDTIIADADVNYCHQPNRSVNICRGGTYCGKLQSEGITDVNNGYVHMYYRVPECSGQGGVHDGEWTQSSGSSNVLEPLCCKEEFPYFEDCFGGETCECVSNEGTYCECAMFVPEQFEPPQVKPGDVQRPLKYISGSIDGIQAEEFCLNFGIVGEDPCIDNCKAEAENFFSSFNLNDTPESDPSRTYGQLYCQAFKARWPSFNQPLTTTLGAYLNAPTCPLLGWLAIEGATHSQPLCCAADGTHISDC